MQSSEKTTYWIFLDCLRENVAPNKWFFIF
nr:MAG TPA: hypothetical protein [Caudoviricetes sp.]DAS54303.1 MAG TPA: hypothetical protein [Caudoviricetes sp.]DAX26075.1 MAG TPA: hypothetical protein [Caudoviricetes sp.]